MVDSPHGKGVTFTIRSAPVGYAAEYPITEFSWVFSPIKRLILYHFHALNTPLPTPPDTLYPTQHAYVRSSFLRGAHFSSWSSLDYTPHPPCATEQPLLRNKPSCLAQQRHFCCATNLRNPLYPHTHSAHVWLQCSRISDG